MPDLAVVRLQSADDGVRDVQDSEHHQTGDPDDQEYQEETDYRVDETRDDPVGDDLAVNIDLWQFVLLDLPDDDGSDESSHRNGKSCQQR